MARTQANAQAAKENDEKLRQEAARAAKEEEEREAAAATARQEMQTRLLEEQTRLQAQLQEQVKVALGEAAAAKKKLATQGLQVMTGTRFAPPLPPPSSARHACTCSASPASPASPSVCRSVRCDSLWRPQNLKDKVVSGKNLKRAKAAGEFSGLINAAKAVKSAEDDAARTAIEVKARADAEAEAAREELKGSVYEPPAGQALQSSMATGALSAARRASQLAKQGRRGTNSSLKEKRNTLGDLESRLDTQLARQTELLGIREEEAQLGQKARQHEVTGGHAQHVVTGGHALPPDRDRRRASAATHRSVAARQHHVVLPSVGEAADDAALPPEPDAVEVAAAAVAGAGSTRHEAWWWLKHRP